MRKLTMIALSCLFLAATSSSTAQAGVAKNRSIIHSYFGTSATAQCTAYRESRFDARATHHNDNGTIDRGLFQINSSWQGVHVYYFSKHHGVDIHIKLTKLYNPTYNVRVTWAITHMKRYGWTPWGGGCSYLV